MNWRFRRSINKFLINSIYESGMCKLKTLESLTIIYQLIFVIWLHWTTCKLLVKIRNVCIRSKNGNEGSFNRFCHQSIPINFLEPWMISDLLWTYSTESVFRIFLKQSHQNVLQLRRCLNKFRNTFGTWSGW